MWPQRHKNAGRPWAERMESRYRSSQSDRCAAQLSTKIDGEASGILCCALDASTGRQIAKIVGIGNNP
ncbi:hypothetical protein GCM10011611_65710 [Aliidongia dinghuensis]|uniref:Uncharacterized protein n=1 Tax=Aliidongia dinghuensis TaxID=1867774 RepID=A0A8J3E7U7_9PROT|nr:hypothetical protein GCM10011611_65710 [Aliidongia dinghuensis]